MLPSRVRSYVCIIILLLVGLAPRVGVAQSDFSGVTELYANAGLSRPISPSGFKDFWDAGNHMALGVGVEGADMFILRSGLRYNNFSLDAEAVRASEQFPEQFDVPADQRFYLLGLTFDLLMDMPSPMRRLSPYVIVGLTLYYTNLNDMTVDENVTQEEFRKSSQLGGGMNVGLGMSHALSRDVKTFVEYEMIGGFMGGDNKVFMPLSVGLAIRL